MKTELRRTCLSCGSEFSGAMEFCPVCMFRKAMSGGAESGEPPSEDTVKPTLEHTAHRFEHYELVTGQDGKPVELGRGAMGVTYKAFDVDLRCPVTLKVISERYLGDELARLRFLREARAAASVRHPNVASVFHLGRTGENYFYAMEFVEGQTLESLIRRSGRLKLKLALEIVKQVAERDIARELEKQASVLHACEAEASMIMALENADVDHDMLPQCRGDLIPGASSIEGVNPAVYRWRQLSSRSPIGVIGDASAASAEKGEKLLAAISADVAEALVNERLWSEPI